jgi:hypothetical protein
MNQETDKHLFFYFRTVRSFIEDNKTLFFLIPTLLGGSWQILELSFIGFDYIRFFSITQLISDGLIILLVLSPILLLGFIFFDGLKKQRKNALDGTKSFLIYLFTFFTCLLFLFLIIRSVFLHFAGGEEYKLDKGFLLFYSIVLTMLIGFIYGATNLFKQKFEKYEKNNLLDSFLLFMSVLKVISLISLIISTVAFLLLTISNYSIPKNALNINKVYQSVKIEYDLEPNQYDIVYMNDKYIFIEYSYLNKIEKDENISKKIIVYKTEKFFENNPSQELIYETIKLNDSMNSTE